MTFKFIMLALFLIIVPIVVLWLIAYGICSLQDCNEEFLAFNRYFFHTDAYKKQKSCITFSQFVSFYNVASDKWDIDLTDRVYYNFDNGFEDIYFTTYGDLYKYLRWRKKQIAYENAIKQNNRMSKLVKEWRKDTVAYQQKAYDNANKAYETILKNISEKK